MISNSTYKLIFKVGVRMGYIVHKPIKDCILLLLKEVNKHEDTKYLSITDIETVYNILSEKECDKIFVSELCNLTLGELKRKYSLNLYTIKYPRQINDSFSVSKLTDIIMNKVDYITLELINAELKQVGINNIMW